jgi:hypothetical protein
MLTQGRLCERELISTKVFPKRYKSAKASKLVFLIAPFLMIFFQNSEICVLSGQLNIFPGLVWRVLD